MPELIDDESSADEGTSEGLVSDVSSDDEDSDEGLFSVCLFWHVHMGSNFRGDGHGRLRKGCMAWRESV